MKIETLYELIYKSTTGDISDAERELLKRELQTNPESKKIFENEAQIDRFFAQEAKTTFDVNLKDEILQRIDAHRYPQPLPYFTEEAGKFRSLISYLRYGLTFVGGAIAMIFIYFSFATSIDTKFDEKQLLGFMHDSQAIQNAESKKSHVLSGSNFTVNFTVSEMDHSAAINFSVTSTENLVFKLLYADQDIKLIGVSMDNIREGATYHADDFSFTFTSLGENQFSLLLSTESIGFKLFKFQVLNADNILAEEEFQLEF